VQALLARIRPVVEASDYEIITGVLNTLPQLLELLAKKNMTLARLRRLLLGFPSEKMAQVLPDPAPGTSDTSASDPPANAPEKKRRPGHGRLGTQAYPGARHVPVAHPKLHVGDLCPKCGTGHL